MDRRCDSKCGKGCTTCFRPTSPICKPAALPSTAPQRSSPQHSPPADAREHLTPLSQAQRQYPTKGAPMTSSTVLPSLAFLAIALAYTGPASAAETAPTATPTDAKKVDWENMSLEQRKKLMKTKVLPE